jgi:hypothetical protein
MYHPRLMKGNQEIIMGVTIKELTTKVEEMEQEIKRKNAVIASMYHEKVETKKLVTDLEEQFGALVDTVNEMSLRDVEADRKFFKSIVITMQKVINKTF